MVFIQPSFPLLNQMPMYSPTTLFSIFLPSIPPECRFVLFSDHSSPRVLVYDNMKCSVSMKMVVQCQSSVI